MRDVLRVEPGSAPALSAVGVSTPADLLALAQGPRPHSVRRIVEADVAGTCGRFFLKAYRYGTWRRSLGLLGRGTLHGVAPSVQEMRALEWLRAHGLPAVRPLAAASLHRRGRLVAQALLTEWLADAPDLAAWVARGEAAHVREPGARRALAGRLGEVVGRMHALGFHHRDLHPRNVLVRPEAPGTPPAVWLLDCRRGGVGGLRRRRAYDLACLLGPGMVDAEAFHAAYAIALTT